MKNKIKSIIYLICIVLITLVLSNIFRDYCLNNVQVHVNALAKEEAYPQYTNKIMGFAGVVRNNTILPIKIKSIKPVDGRGVEYVDTVITEWGFSEISREDLAKKESVENKIIEPLTEYNVGYFYKFTGEYMVNPDVLEISYSIFGINFKNR